MTVAVTQELPVVRVDDHTSAGGRPSWVRRLEIALVLLVLPVALALAVKQVVGASTAAASRRPAVAEVPVLVVDGGGGTAAVADVVEKLRAAGVAARATASTGRQVDLTDVLAPRTADDTVVATVRRALGLGTSASPPQLHYGTDVTVVVGKDALQR